jgi:hypothetical protein
MFSGETVKEQNEKRKGKAPKIKSRERSKGKICAQG